MGIVTKIIGRTILAGCIFAGTTVYDVMDMTDRIADKAGLDSYYAYVVPGRLERLSDKIAEGKDSRLSQAVSEEIKNNKERYRALFEDVAGVYAKDKAFLMDMYERLPEDSKDQLIKIWFKDKYNDSVNSIKRFFKNE